MKQHTRYETVLSIYPNTRGFGFTLFEGPLSPVDWGVVEARGRGKSRHCLRRVTGLCGQHQPEALILQNMTPSGTRRAHRIRQLNEGIELFAETQGIPVFAYSRAEVNACFAYLGTPTKHSIGDAIAKALPAFEQYLLPPRKIWKSEDARMGIFDAAALALTFFQERSRISDQTQQYRRAATDPESRSG